MQIHRTYKKDFSEGNIVKTDQHDNRSKIDFRHSFLYTMFAFNWNKNIDIVNF